MWLMRNCGNMLLVTELFGRLFGTWTLMSCTLCVLTAYPSCWTLIEGDLSSRVKDVLFS